MSQANENDQAAATTPASSKDLVGDILRKERITRRITVETIARDLKLNVKYIKSLEANEYSDLPADPYVRVYLKSLAKYLSLDSEAILKQFYGERGLGTEPSPRESPDRIPITMKQKEESHNPLLIVAIVLICLLALFSFIAKKQGWINVPDAGLPASTAPTDNEFIDPGTTTDSLLADSLIPVTPPQPSVPEDSQKTSSVPGATSQTATGNAAPADTAGKFRLSLSVVKDSVWLQVYTDGVSWKNVVYKGQNRTFTARDSFNVHAGNIAAVKFAFNDKPLTVQGKGVTAFKLDRSGIAAKWPLSQWSSVFKNRL